MNKSNKAFSLIEFSIVGLVISILVAGTIQSHFLSRKAILANARSQTASSSVVSIGNLMLWYESTSKKSFRDSESIDGKLVSVWYDLNPEINALKNNASQVTQINRPTYKINKINGLPAVEFDRSDANFMLFDDGSGIVNSEYTIFIVGQRSDSGASDFIGGSETTTDSNLRIGYESDTSIAALHWGNGVATTCSAYIGLSPIIISVTFNFDKRNIYVNGELQATTPIGTADETQALISYAGAGLGAYASNYLEGDIGEIIIFKKYLKTEEKKSVERYLGKKWKIEIN